MGEMPPPTSSLMERHAMVSTLEKKNKKPPRPHLEQMGAQKTTKTIQPIMKVNYYHTFTSLSSHTSVGHNSRQEKVCPI